MKKILATLMFLISAATYGQANSDQVLIKTDGGLVGDSLKALVVAPKGSTTAPTSPVTNQLWLDTTASPATLKRYNGSVWEAVVNLTTLTTQADLSSFPSSPTEGQCFIDWSHCAQWCWNNSASKWYLIGQVGSCTATGPAIVDNFTGTGITDPTLGSMTSADNATAGNLTVGAHSFKMSCANSTGGETNPTAFTPSVSFTASHSFNLSSIPTCSGGPTTTARLIYMSKAGGQTTGPWYWSGVTIADNSTTSLTAQVGLADANLVLLAPKKNYSAALNARWTVTNSTGATTTGGCGSTGTAMACRSSNTPPTSTNATSDATVRAAVDLSSYNGGDYTIQYRISYIGITADVNDGTLIDPQIGGMRVTSADNGIMKVLHVGLDRVSTDGVANTMCSAATANSWSTPVSSGNPMHSITAITRQTVAANYSINGANCNTINFTATYPFPRATSVIWVRWVKRGTNLQAYVSADGLNWMSTMPNQNATGSNGPVQTWDISVNLPSQFELDVMQSAVNSRVRHYIELDNFTLTVN